MDTGTFRSLGRRLVTSPVFGSAAFVGHPASDDLRSLFAVSTTLQYASGILCDHDLRGDIPAWMDLRQCGGRFCSTPAILIFTLRGVHAPRQAAVMAELIGLFRLMRTLRIAFVIQGDVSDLPDGAWDRLMQDSSSVTVMTERFGRSR